MSKSETGQVALKDMTHYQLLCQIVPNLPELIKEPSPANKELINRAVKGDFKPFSWMQGCM